MVHNFRLKNGRVAAIRQASRADATLLWDMHQHLSTDTVYKRYHRHYDPTQRELEMLCDVKPDEGMVFIVTVDDPKETVIGHAYYVIDDRNPGIAEPAVVVADDYQRIGIGGLMMKHMGEYAVQHGIHQFRTFILPNNDGVVRLIRRVGVSFHSTIEHGTREILIDLENLLPYSWDMSLQEPALIFPKPEIF